VKLSSRQNGINPALDLQQLLQIVQLKKKLPTARLNHEERCYNFESSIW